MFTLFFKFNMVLSIVDIFLDSISSKILLTYILSFLGSNISIFPLIGSSLLILIRVRRLPVWLQLSHDQLVVIAHIVEFPQQNGQGKRIVLLSETK